jgi:hypothetical protein
MHLKNAKIHKKDNKVFELVTILQLLSISWNLTCEIVHIQAKDLIKNKINPKLMITLDKKK